MDSASAEKLATQCWRPLLLALHKRRRMDSETILEWELEQHKLLDSVADRCDWSYTHREYKARLRWIQAQVRLRMKGLAGSQKEPGKLNSTAECGPKMASPSSSSSKKLPPPIGWDLAPSSEPNGRKFKSVKEAEVLLGPAKYSEWKLDRDAPSGFGVRRYISVHPKRQDKFERRRLVWLKKGYHRCTHGMHVMQTWWITFVFAYSCAGNLTDYYKVYIERLSDQPQIPSAQDSDSGGQEEEDTGDEAGDQDQEESEGENEEEEDEEEEDDKSNENEDEEAEPEPEAPIVGKNNQTKKKPPNQPYKPPKNPSQSSTSQTSRPKRISFAETCVSSAKQAVLNKRATRQRK